MKNKLLILIVLALVGCGSSLPKLQYPDGSLRIPIIPEKQALESTPPLEKVANPATSEVACNNPVKDTSTNPSVTSTSIVTIKCSDPVRKNGTTKKARKAKSTSAASINPVNAEVKSVAVEK